VPKLNVLSGLLLPLFIIGSAANLRAAEAEMIGTVVYHHFADQPLPDLTDGYGFGFGITFLPVKKAGVSFGVITSRHDLLGGDEGGRQTRVDSEVSAVFLQANYRFFNRSFLELEALLAATYDNINGGDNSGSYLEFRDFNGYNSEEIGYSGWGTALGLGVIRPIQSGYFVYLGVRYNFLTYSAHQFFVEQGGQLVNVKFTGSQHEQAGDSWIFNLGVGFRINFSQF